MDSSTVIGFIKDSQPKEWAKFERVFTENAEKKFFARLISEIDKNGTVEVLRNGFKDYGAYFNLFYPKPNNNKNPDYLRSSIKMYFQLLMRLNIKVLIIQVLIILIGLI